MFRRLLTLCDLAVWLAKTALDERMRRLVTPGVCTRRHTCRLDGPCNGYPRVRK
jgi:hypothetical protein